MSNATKTKIIKRAQELMWFQGYDGASVNDVVSKAGVSKGAFFHHFPNKQAVTREALHKYAREEIFSPLDKHMTAVANPKTGLLTWLQEMHNSYAQWKFKGGCMMGNMALALSDRDPALREDLKQLFLQWENQLVGYLRPAQRDGKLLMEARQFARLLIATLEGITMTAKVHKDQNRASREFLAVGEMIERLMKD